MAPVIIKASERLATRVIVTDESAETHPILDVMRGMSGLEIRNLRDFTQSATDADARRSIETRDTNPLATMTGVGDQTAVVLDWDYSTFARRICECARDCDRVSISLPHGDAPYVNLMINLNDIDGRLRRHYEQAAIFDHTVVPNAMCGERYVSLPHDRIHVLGSPRYNRAWRMQLSKQMRHEAPDNSMGGLRVAMFTRNANFPIHWDEVERSLEMIDASGDVELVIKHHTRAKDMDTLFSTHPLLRDGRPPALRIADANVDSPALLRWADVVVDLGTSIAFEAVLDGIPVLELEYVHANRSTIAEYFPASDMRCRDDFAASLATAHLEPAQLAPSDADVERFIRTMVEPDGPDVLENYCRLLTEARPVSHRPSAVRPRN